MIQATWKRLEVCFTPLAPLTKGNFDASLIRNSCRYRTGYRNVGSPRAGTRTSVETTSHKSAVVRQAPLAVINADDAARPTTENQPSMFLSSKNLLILGAGLVIVALVSGFSVRSAMKAAEENTIL